MNFTTPFPEQVLYAFAYGNFCPRPQPHAGAASPATGGESYEAFADAFPPDYMNFPAGRLGGGGTSADDIVIMRRNPYYWKVDEAGNQLPYLNEMHYRLSTWSTGIPRPLRAPVTSRTWNRRKNYVEALQRAADPAAPARLAFGPRTIGYSLYMNFSANGWGNPDERAQAIRELNRNLDFRMGVTQAVDRARIGDSLVRGPFTVQYPGGLLCRNIVLRCGLDRVLSVLGRKRGGAFCGGGPGRYDGNGLLNFPKARPAGQMCRSTCCTTTSSTPTPTWPKPSSR